MSLVNNSANNFKDFLDAIKPYLNYQFYDLSGQGVEANNFSTNEKVIGTWIDGKPLYQKTVDCGTLPNNTTKTVAHGISNLDEVKTVFGYGYRSSDATSIFFPDNSLLAVWIKGNDIYLSDSADRSSYTESYVTIQYTKTTDTAVASGEKIVGQWIDGKPLYEKVFTSEFPNMNSDTNISLSSYNIDVVTYLNAIIIGTDSPLIPAYMGTGVSITGNVFITPDKVLKLRNNNHETYSGKTTYITLHYTKTTD